MNNLKIIYSHKLITLGLISLLLLPLPVFAKDVVMKNYQYNSINDTVSFEVTQVNLYQIIEVLAKKQNIEVQIAHVPNHKITGKFSGKTDKVIKELLQTDNLILVYKKIKDSSRLSSVEALIEGKENSSYLSKGEQSNIGLDDSEEMHFKEEQRKRREYRHSMGLGRINQQPTETEPPNQKN